MRIPRPLNGIPLLLPLPLPLESGAEDFDTANATAARTAAFAAAFLARLEGGPAELAAAAPSTCSPSTRLPTAAPHCRHQSKRHG